MKSMRILIAAILSAMAGLTVAAPAQAAQNCPSATFCLYDTSVTAYPFELRENADTSSGYCHQLGSGKASWVRNQTSRAWRVYQNGICGGFQQTINANSSAALNSQLNNVTWSYKRV